MGIRRTPLQKTLKKTFLPVMGVVIVSLLIFIMLFSLALERHSRQSLFSQQKDQLHFIDAQFQSLQMSGLPLFLVATGNESVADYLYAQRTLDRGELLTVLKQLENAMANNDVAAGIYLYNSHNGILSSQDGWLPLSEQERRSIEAYLGTIAYPAPGFITDIPLGSMVPSLNTTEDNPLLTMVVRNTLWTASPAGGGEGVEHAVFFTYKERLLRERIGLDATGLNTAFVINEENLYVSHPDASFVGRPLYENTVAFRKDGSESSQGRARLSSEEPGRAHELVSWRDIPSYRLRVVLTSREDSAYAVFQQLKTLTISGFLLSFLFSLLVSVIMVMRQEGRATEVRRALHYLQGNTSSQGNTVGVFQRLILRIHPDGGITRMKGPCHMALIIEDESLIPLPQQTGDSPQSGFFHERILEKYPGALILPQEDGRYILIIPSSENTGALQSSLAGVLRVLSVPGGPSYGGYLTEEPVGVLHFPHAYACLTAEADSRDYIRSVGALVVLEGKNLQLSPPTHEERTLPQIDFKAFDAALRLASPVAMKETLDTILDELIALENPAFFTHVAFLLVSRVPALLGKDFSTVFPQGSRYFQSMGSSIRHTHQVMDVVLPVVEDMALLRNQSSVARRQSQIEEIKAYVQEHVADSSLNVEQIAAHFHFSTNYLRTYFKQNAGLSLPVFIGEERISYASRLLIETDLPVKEICGRAGFINYSYFFTYFRKNTGLTPLDYRKQHQK